MSTSSPRRSTKASTSRASTVTGSVNCSPRASSTKLAASWMARSSSSLPVGVIIESGSSSVGAGSVAGGASCSSSSVGADSSVGGVVGVASLVRADASSGVSSSPPIAQTMPPARSATTTAQAAMISFLLRPVSPTAPGGSAGG